MFGLFNFLKSDNEIKRDHYYKLYQRLNDAIIYHDNKVNEANQYYDSYRNSVPFFSTTRIPTDDFERKRSELNDKLTELFEHDKQQRLRLIIARDRAYSRYEHYKNLAMAEKKG